MANSMAVRQRAKDQMDTASGERSEVSSPHPGVLPTEKTAPRTSLEDLSVLLYGPSKVGKSTWCSLIPDALFLATEPGLNSLEVYQTPITSWDGFLAACREIEAGEHPFKVIVVDTIDNLYRLCVDHFRKKLGILHESDLGFGKAYSLINDDFHRVLTKLSFMPYGLVLVSHSEEREISTRTGKVTRTVPSLPEKARRIVLALVDMILFVDLKEVPAPGAPSETRRVIHTKPHARYEAGDRTGRLPDSLPLDVPAFLNALKKRST